MVFICKSDVFKSLRMRIREYVEDHPKSTAREIAEGIGENSVRISSYMWKMVKSRELLRKKVGNKHLSKRWVWEYTIKWERK